MVFSSIPAYLDPANWQQQVLIIFRFKGFNLISPSILEFSVVILIFFSLLIWFLFSLVVNFFLCPKGIIQKINILLTFVHYPLHSLPEYTYIDIFDFFVCFFIYIFFSFLISSSSFFIFAATQSSDWK